MSEQSYWENVEKRVTGPRSANCMMAAYDRISPRLGISTATYVEYERHRREYVRAVTDNGNYVPREFVRKFAELKARARAELGVHTDKNVVKAHVDTRDELHRTLGDMTLGGFRPMVYLDVGGLHGVGVMRADPSDDEFYYVRSTWTPFRTDDPVHVDDIYEYLDHPVRQRRRPGTARRSLKEVNIVALPPEPRHKRIFR